MDNLITFDKILRTAKQVRRYDAETVRKTEEEIQKAQNQIAELEKVQKNHFQALSEEDQRRMCEIVGLNYLADAFSAGEEMLPTVSELMLSDKPKEASQDGITTLQETDQRVEAVRGVGTAPQVPDKPTESSPD